MMADRIVKISRHVYDRLLLLYPLEFREEYGTSMGQVFADQCRSAVWEKSLWGMVALWFLTLVDFSASLLREHIAVPGATEGLLEKAPDAPLPWKGVALVLVPGLVFFTGQIGQLAGRNWFSWLNIWGAFFMIIPVAWIWISRRKLPIWGLVPVGILLQTVFFDAEVQRLQQYFHFNSILTGILRGDWGSQSEKYPLLTKIVVNFSSFINTHTYETMALEMALLIGFVALLIFQIIRKCGSLRAVLFWTGIFFVITVVNAAIGIFSSIQYFASWHEKIIAEPNFVIGYVWPYFYYNGLHNLGYFSVVLVGVLLSRRHCWSAILILFGFLMPITTWGMQNDFMDGSVISGIILLTVLVYRVMVTLIAPIWIVRSVSDRMEKRTSIIGLAAAMGIVALSYLSVFFISFAMRVGSTDLFSLYFDLSWEFITLVGIILSMSLFGSEISIQTRLQTESGLVKAK